VVTWDKGALDASGVWPETAVPFDIKGKLSGEPPYQLSFAMTPLDLRARLRVMETNGMLNAKLATFYKDNRADLDANFARGGQLPVNATLQAPDFKLPADLLKLEKYSEVTGSLRVQWETNEYTLELKARAEPLVSAGEIPAADVELSARGDTNSVMIERAVSTIPGLQLTVSSPLEVSYEGKMLSERSELRVDADLEKVPGVKLKGRVKGTILLEQGGEFPKATFQAGGTNVSAFQVEAESVQAEGTLDWPKMESLKAAVRFSGESFLEVEGGADLRSRTLQETIIRAEGAYLTNLLPGSTRFTGTQMEAKVSGPITNLAHAGRIEVRNFIAPQLNPLQIEASWKAQHITFDDLAFSARAGPSRVFVRGSGYAGGNRTNFVVRQFELLKGDEIYLRLSEAARLTISSNFAVELGPFNLQGGEGKQRHLQLSAGIEPRKTMAFEVQATNINPALFQSFTPRSLRGLDVEYFNLLAMWSNGPVTGTLNGRVSVQEENFERLSAAADVELKANGFHLREVTISNPQAEIGRASGLLPVRILPKELSKVAVIADQEIEFQAMSVPNDAFWQTVSRLTKLQVSNAAVNVRISGTPRRLAGELQVRGEGLAYVQTNRALPEVGPFEGKMTLNPELLRVPELSFQVEGQSVQLTGELPLGTNFWTQRREEIAQYALENARARIRAPDVQLAPFTEYLPKHLRAQGELFADVSILPGQNFSGVVRIRDVETRPLPKIGVVQEIEADLALQGKELYLESVSGVLGGELLSLEGKVDLSAESVAKGYPDLDLSIRGSNVPLARNPDVILRSDLDLRVTNSVKRIPVVSGVATLRDSFLLRDITTLVPGRVARPERRPPYFSLPQDPIDEWLLDVRVRGENFMRVRSPFFQGLASANFHVTGTMVEPVALGEASVTSGTVIFPFATLRVRQAFVSLTSESPYLPQIFVVAGGRAFGFDVRMEAEGPADEPVIEFSSVPALTSEQIVLMLTTGQIPRDDFGFSTEDRASRLAFFLGKNLWAKLNPGKPAEERLTIRSGEDVTEQGKQTYEVEYKLNERWSLVGEYNRFGDLNGNVKWRVFSK
jgi:translocation and assembly module TamB